MSERISIRGGRLLDPASGRDGVGELAMAGGQIVGVGEPPEGFVPDRIIDATGKIVCPGFVDLAARLREPGQEHKATIASESRAAAAGGITTLCCPPDTDPVIDTPAVARLIRERAQKIGGVRILPLGALTRGLGGQDLSEMAALKAAGCRAVSNARAPLASARVLRRALEYAASHELLVIVQAEDPSLADHGCVHEGPVSTRLGLPGIPYAAETVAMAQVVALVEHTGARVHFARLSSAPAVRAVARAQEKGLAISADVAAHQLHLTEADVDGFDARCHLRPPLRSTADRAALREAVRSGVIGAICSDHQPHEADAKLDAFPATEPGMAALQTLLPLTLELVAAGEFGLRQAICALTAGPARVLGIDAGTLRVGAPADVTVFDPAATWVVDRDTWLSNGQNTPYWGRRLCGRVTATFLGGRQVFGDRSGESRA